MTRKHFRKLAAAIAALDNEHERRRMAQAIGDVCADSNERFDWTVWRVACNAED